MITLYGFGPAFGLPDPSPFVIKAEVLLKLSGLPFRTERGSPRRAPKGKLPYIDDDGVRVGDSTFIRLHLEQRHGIDFDAGLSPEARGTGWAVDKLLEDHLYWALTDARWLDRGNFDAGPASFFRVLPAPARPLAKAAIRRMIRFRLRAHGMGRHQTAEIAMLGARAVNAIADVMGDRPFLLGARPSAADATLFGFVLPLFAPGFASSARAAVEHRANLLAHRDRMLSMFYPEYAPG